MIKSMAVQKLSKIRIKRMKKRVISQCLSNRERRKLWREDWELQRVLKSDFRFLTGIYSECIVPDATDDVDSDAKEASRPARDKDDDTFEDF